MNQNLFDYVIFGKDKRNRKAGFFGFLGVFNKFAVSSREKSDRNYKESFINNVNPDLTQRNDLTLAPNSSKVPGKKIDPFMPYILLFSFLVFFSLLIFLYRSFDLQVLKTSEYSKLASGNRTRNYEIPAPRGVIYDRLGKVIAQNRPTFNLVLNIPLCAMGRDFSICEKIISEVAMDIQLEDRDALIKALHEQHLESIILAKDLEKDQIITIESKAFPALDILAFPSREYLYPNEFAHLIGYTGLSSTSMSPVIEGKMGLEEFYNDILKGLPGKRITQVNSRNEGTQNFDTQDPVPGKNIELFVDSGLQRLAYEILREVVDGVPVTSFETDKVTKTQDYIEGFSKKAKAGVVVAQDPKTGGILALVSYPSFDAQKMVSGITSKELSDAESSGPFPFFNRAINAAYAPGSTFKLVMASAILEEGIATPNTTIFDTGSISVAGYVFKNWKLDGHGSVDLFKALQVSNDPYFYTMGGGYGGISGLGINRINKWATMFGFGAKTGIDLPGEISGFVPNSDYKDWYLGDTYITSIGQGDLLSTPLQVSLMTSYFANGSELLKPRVVKSIENEVTSQEVLARDLVSSSTMAVVREGVLRAASPGGTGYPVYDFAEEHNGVVVAGKTGTSEYIDPQGNYDTHAMFTAWAPYEDAEIVLTVFLEGGGSGAHDAAPVARRLLDYWFEGR